ncbi:hypothetical protein PGT21_024946 [Puccinia graminis f. sp. tritici]|uniref:Uncharacterized protein n=1 Tax=Puccinia graminis f. sp. tritici TaxID=56615 RepID=A0A5B0S422_PUCGR|nr:hypothetical protein PGT21_024946 [Puccinia graminis f. sp. tritici]KAA1132567.1 hypothetical protein PGTUg99_007070 [Puccinia graminis f. sp. tritici]
MNLQATVVLFTVAVMITAVVQAPWYPLCPWCRKAYSTPCTSEQIAQFKLTVTGPCNCKFTSMSNCQNIVPKANLICMDSNCLAIFCINPGYRNRKVHRECYHPATDIIRRGICPASDISTPGTSDQDPPNTTDDEDQ